MAGPLWKASRARPFQTSPRCPLPATPSRRRGPHPAGGAQRVHAPRLQRCPHRAHLARGRSSDRMIYYYFGSKEALYIAGARGRLHRARRRRKPPHARREPAGHRPRARSPSNRGRPAEALDQLIAFTWRYYLAHPEFVALLSNENLQRGRHITKSLKVKLLSRPVLDILGRQSSTRARARGVFRADLDVEPGLPDARRARVLLSLQPLHAVELSSAPT